MSETITISLDEKVAREFRKNAKQKFGKRKGYLKSAITDAIKIWTQVREDDIDAHALRTLEKGFKMDGMKTKNRADWHER